MTVTTPRSHRQFDAPTLGGELGLLAVTTALAVSLVRAFTEWAPLGRLVGCGVLAHVVAIAQRRIRLPALVATVISLSIGMLVISLLHYRGLSWYGFPTRATIDQLGVDSRAAFGPFKKLVPPVPTTPGFEVAFAIAIWLVATFADLAAFRADAPVQAVVAHVAGFVFSSVLVLGRFAELASVAMTVSLAAFALAVRSARLRRPANVGSGEEETPSPFGGQTQPSRAWMWRSGTPMIAVVIIAAMATAPLVPRPTGGRAVDLRALGRGPDPRVVESPLVGLDSLLGAQSNAIMFTAQSERAHYWRLTSLETFDGRSWSAKARYRDVDSGDVLDSPFASDLRTERETARFTVKDLRSDWLPSVFAPRRADASVDVRFDADSSSIFVSDESTIENARYSIESDVLAIGAADQLRQRAPGAGDSMDRYLALPDDVNGDVADLADRIMADADPFTAATALESYFRSFTYDRSVDFTSSDDPLTEFLRARRGFCQQFAAAFAAMARSVGIPSRVAVGFTYGDISAPDASAPDAVPTWTVRGRHGHAWPEINIAGVGWVAFEPTPGRGNPDNTGFSGIEPAQSNESGGVVIGTGSSTSTTTTATSAPGRPSSAPDADRAVPRIATSTAATPATTRWVTIAILTILMSLVVGAIVRLIVVRRRDHRIHDDTLRPDERVAASWRRVVDDLGRVGVLAGPSETPNEFARRAAPQIENEELADLGASETYRRYRQSPITPGEARDAARISDQIRSVVWSRLDLAGTLRARLDLDPRSTDLDTEPRPGSSVH